MELLSPAKNLNTGIIAINSGADAVYIGASEFGARKAAANPVADIEKLCNYAHLYGAKVYVTLNTILYDNELEQARKLIHQLYEAGSDAIIIQDLGILKMDIPPIELHASTQTHNYDMDRIQFLDKLGFKRIVLARESSLEHIHKVRQSIKAEIECFVHGALCVSFSGQCYMSAQLGGRSANRGECAQACRMKYSLLNADKKLLIDDSYILSLRDFGAFNKIKEMMEAGVDSLKIEGRLKDESYVANVTAYYRKIIDGINNGAARNSLGTCVYDYEPNVNKVFNRGFTEYFLNGNAGKMANFASPKSMGEKIGKLIGKKGNTITIATSQTINNGDGLCYIDGNSLFGFRIEKAVGNNSFIISTEQNIKPGVQLYRNLDTIFQKKIEHTKSVRIINISIRGEYIDEKLRLTITDEEGFETWNEITVTEKANNEEKALINLKNAISKCGERYQVKDIKMDCRNGVPFVPNSVANELRRKTLEAHEQKRIEHFGPKGYPTPSANIKYPAETGDYRLNVSNHLAREFYKDHGCNITEPAFELLDKTKGKEVMTTKYCIRREMGYCTKTAKNIPDEWRGSRFILHGAYQDFDLTFNCKDCMMQIFAKK